MMETPDLSITIVDDDILCGRGRGLESFPGNKVFRRIIKEHASFYVDPKTSRSAKSRLVQRIAARLSAENMRFLKKLKGGWRQLEEYDAKLKVGHALRDAGVERRKQQFKKKRALPKKQQTKLPAVHDVALVSDEEDNNSHTSSHQSSEDQASMDQGPVFFTGDDNSSFPLVEASETVLFDALPFKTEQSQSRRSSTTSFGAFVDDMDFSKPVLIEDLYSDESCIMDGNVTPERGSLEYFAEEEYIGEEEGENSIISKTAIDFDVTLSAVFLSFLNDEGDADDMTLKEIDPDNWVTSR